MMAMPKQIDQNDIRNGRYRSADFAPPLWQIPPAFLNTANAWGQVASELMWAGSKAVLSATPRAGISAEAAMLHIGAVLLAIDMTVEHREAAAAYLMSEWFEAVATATTRASHARQPAASGAIDESTATMF